MNVDEELAKLQERIGENCGQITINRIERHDGVQVEVKAYVHVYGENRNIVGPGLGTTVGEAIKDLELFIERQEELYVWPWWADPHSTWALEKTTEKK